MKHRLKNIFGQLAIGKVYYKYQFNRTYRVYIPQQLDIMIRSKRYVNKKYLFEFNGIDSRSDVSIEISILPPLLANEFRPKCSTTVENYINFVSSDFL